LNSEEEFIVPSIYTSNIEAKLKLIEEYGGKVLKGKTPIGKNAEYGYFALFEDPDGNRICLYSTVS
jgi:predicted enzyme related to lactoylglutathione lyase